MEIEQLRRLSWKVVEAVLKAEPEVLERFATRHKDWLNGVSAAAEDCELGR
jgi:hypothetical protein